MIAYKYEISRQCYEKIYEFYYHVALNTGTHIPKN